MTISATTGIRLCIKGPRAAADSAIAKRGIAAVFLRRDGRNGLLYYVAPFNNLIAVRLWTDEINYRRVVPDGTLLNYSIDEDQGQ